MYPPDSSHFLNQVTLVTEALNGDITWEIAFLTWSVWPITLPTWQRTKLFLLLLFIFTLVVGWMARIWIPLNSALNLSSNFSNTIWKYGNGGAEFGIKNYTYTAFIHMVSA